MYLFRHFCSWHKEFTGTFEAGYKEGPVNSIPKDQVVLFKLEARKNENTWENENIFIHSVLYIIHHIISSYEYNTSYYDVL